VQPSPVYYGVDSIISLSYVFQLKSEIYYRYVHLNLIEVFANLVIEDSMIAWHGHQYLLRGQDDMVLTYITDK
jgi:hypothetical protein